MAPEPRRQERTRQGLLTLMLLVLPFQAIGLSLPGWIELYLGEVPVLLIAAMWGPRQGLLAACLAGACTGLIQGHPYGLPSLALEGLVVGWLLPHTGLPLMMLALAYWLLIGGPLQVLLAAGPLGLGQDVQLLLGAHLVLGGLVHGLLADLARSLLPLDSWLAPPRGRPRTNLLRTASLVLAAAALLPALGLSVLDGVARLRGHREQTRVVLDRVASGAAASVRAWLREARASLAGLPGPGILEAPRERTELLLGQIREAFPDFHLLALTDLEGNVLALRTSCGVAAAPEHATWRHRASWPPRPGRAGPSPDGCGAVVVPLILPVHDAGGETRAHLVAALSLEALPRRVPSWGTASGNRFHASLTDAEGRYLGGTGAARSLLEVVPRERGGEMRWLDRHTAHWLPPGETFLERWRASRLEHRELLGADLPWTLETTVPLENALGALTGDLLLRLAGLVVLALALTSLATATPVTRRALAAVERLVQRARGGGAEAGEEAGIDELVALDEAVTALRVDRDNARQEQEELSRRLRSMESACEKAEADAAEAREVARLEGFRSLGRLRLFEEIFRRCGDAAAVLDPTGRYLARNDAHRALFELEDEKLFGRPLALHLGSEASERLLGSLSARGAVAGVFPARTRRGDEVALDVTAFSVPDEDDAIAYMVVLARDVTHGFQRERHLEEAREALEEAIAARADLCAHLSHELRTPLHGVLGMADVLHEVGTGPPLAAPLEHLRSAALELRDLVEDLMVLHGLETGEVPLARSATPPAEVLRRVAAAWAATPRGGPRSLEVDAGAGLERPLMLDAERLVQATRSLLAAGLSAVEPVASIRLRGRIEGGCEDRVALALSLEVEGTARGGRRLVCGVRRGDLALARALGSTGLHLPVAAGLVELMGGSLSLEVGGAPALQATMSLELAPAPADAAVAAAEASPPRPAAAPPGRALVAEDNEVNRILVEALLRNRGWTSKSVATGRATVAAVAAERFDLVLMDLHMPDLDGLEATRRIRAHEDELGLARVPILALTADALPGTRSRCLEAGMDDYLAKPLDVGQFDALLSRIREA